MIRLISPIVILIVLAFNSVSTANDTTFTYQGELKQNSNPANGLFDIDFALWDAVSAGNQIDWTIEVREVPVVEGRFTVELDFGANAFDNNDRWLEIAVNGNTLSPRTPITRAPYSIQTRGIFVNDAGDVGIGTAAPLDQLHVFGDAPALRLEDDYISYTALRNAAQTQAQLQKLNLFGNVIFDIDPMPLDGTSGAELRLFRSTNTTGLKRVLFYRGNDSATTSAAIGLDGADSYFQLQGGNLGIGTATPEYPLHTESGSSGATIYGHASRPNGVTYGVYGRCDSEDNGTGVFGWATSSDGFSKGVFGQTLSAGGFGVMGDAQSNTGVNYGVYGSSKSSAGYGVYGSAASHSGVNFGVYGNSQSSAGYDFYAGGAGQDYGSSSSRRWKSNIVAIDQPLEKISQLEGVYFDWDKEHGGHHDVGMIAEDVGAVLPEIVHYEENGVDADGMDYSKLTPLLVESVKALYDKQNSLERENATLQTRNDAMQARLDSLEKLVEHLAGNLEKQNK